MATDTKLTSKQLFNHLFEACNILRGPINQDEYKNYVTPIIFYKRLCDVYDEETQYALEISGGDYEFANFPENHRFVIPEGCHWNDIRARTENIGGAIVYAINRIERANPHTLYGTFSFFDEANWTDKNKLSDERLKDLIEHMSKVNLGNNSYSSDILGDSYEFLIKKFADLSKKNAGEFYTPRSIVKLMVKILAPKAGETVYDPACGTGGMLIEAIRYIHNDKMVYGKIYGQEKNLANSALAKMNLLLHGAIDFSVSQGDTLRNPLFLNRGSIAKFDCVIANPPFSLDNWGEETFANDIYGRNIWGTPPASNGDYVWIQHMVCSMARNTGRCAVVLPQGVLFRGNKEYNLRKEMVESDKLECIISLANNLFYGATIPACILIFREKKADDKAGKVLMIDASSIYTPKRAQNVLEENDVEQIFTLYSNFRDEKEKAKLITLDDIRKKDYILTVNQYIEREQKPNITYEEAKTNFIKAMEDVFAAEEEFYKLLKEYGYIDE